MHVPHSSQRFHQRAERQARYRGYDILMQRRDLCWTVTMKPSRPEPGECEPDDRGFLSQRGMIWKTPR